MRGHSDIMMFQEHGSVIATNVATPQSVMPPASPSWRYLSFSNEKVAQSRGRTAALRVMRLLTDAASRLS